MFNEHDTWVDRQGNMEHVVKSYFTKLLTASENIIDIDAILGMVRACISADDNHLLEADFDDEEFRLVVRQMHIEKSLCPNGFNPAFYKKFWG